MWAFSLNADDGSEWRRSIEESVADAARGRRGGGDDDSGGGGGGEGGRFVDLSASLEADAAAAPAAAPAGLHALVGLNGFDARAVRLLALRPAPVAMHAVGFPGTMGARFVPYMLLDAPRAAARRGRADRAPRADAALLPGERPPQLRGRGARGGGGGGGGDRRRRRRPPACGAALVNFNQLYKLTPTALRAWCGVLGAAPRASLWLLAQPPTHGGGGVWREAAACGLRRARVVIAPIGASRRRHLARVGGAQLALDTPEYNCHTTGSDALFAGVPLLTLPGEQMASRVAAPPSSPPPPSPPCAASASTRRRRRGSSPRRRRRRF